MKYENKHGWMKVEGKKIIYHLYSTGQTKEVGLEFETSCYVCLRDGLFWLM